MDIGQFFAIAFSAIFVSNFVLARFLGLCPFLGVSGKVKTAWNMGLAVVFVMIVSSICAYGINHLLVRYELEFLRLICYIAVIASAVRLVEMFVKKFSPALFRTLGIFLPLIAVNCAILGASLFMAERQYTLAESTVFGLGSGIGWMLAIVSMAAIRQKLRTAHVPAPLRGLGITFIVTGLIAMAFMTFSGIQL